MLIKSIIFNLFYCNQFKKVSNAILTELGLMLIKVTLEMSVENEKF